MATDLESHNVSLSETDSAVRDRYGAAAQLREASPLLAAMVEMKTRAVSIAAEHSAGNDIELPDGMRDQLEKLGYLE